MEKRCFVLGLCGVLLQMAAVVAQSVPIEIDRAVGQVKLAWPSTTTGFGLESTTNLTSPVSWSAFTAMVANENGRWLATIPAGASAQFFRLHNTNATKLTVIESTSPIQGEGGVSVNRETVLYFSAALATNTTITPEKFYAESGGRRLLSRVQMAADGRKVSLFVLEPMPAGARTKVTLDGDTLLDASGTALDADGDGQPGGVATLEFNTMNGTALPGTGVIGHVYASDPAGAPGSITNRPLSGVLITVDGAEEKLRASTDATGFFRLQPCPAGRFFVHIDGRRASGSHWPDGDYYPVVGKTFEALAGQTNTLAGGTGEIFLPLIKAGTLQPVSLSEATTISFPPNVLAQNPSLEGVKVTVPANALFSDSGLRGGRVGIAPVAPDRIPSPLPPGLQFPLVITIQTDGPGNFDTPAPVQFPNLPDPVTGKKLGPGEKTWLWSFNHDSGKWEPQGTMTISADGLFAVTDPGVGVRQPGWHGVNPGSPPKFPSYPPQIIRPPRKPCQPITPEQIQANAQADLDCFGQAIPFFNAVKQLVAAASSVNDLGASVTEFLSGSTVGTLHAACAAIFAAKSLKEAVGDGLSLAANKQALADILECEVNVLKNDLLISCQISACLGQKGPPTVCQQVLDTLESIDSILSEASSFSEDPTAYSKSKLEEAAEAACGALENIPEEPTAGLQARVSGTSIDPNTLNQLRAAMAPALDQVNLLQRIVNEFVPLANRLQALEEIDRNIIDLLHSPNWTQFDLYRNCYYRLAYNGVELRGRSTALGEFDLPVLAPETDYTFEIYDPALNIVASSSGKSAPAGQTTSIPAPAWLFPGWTDLSGDTDGDGLTARAESVVGLRDDKKDTDGDGIADLVELRQGLDPLSGLNLPLGVVANVPLNDEAYAVRHHGGLAYLATANSGLAIVDISKPDAPVTVSQLDLPGFNFALAISPAHQIVAVAADPERIVGNDDHLHFVDVRDPANPRLIRSLSIEIEDIEEDQGLFFAALKREVRIYDPATQLELGWVGVSDDITGIAAKGGRLYVSTESALDIYEVTLPTPNLLGRLTGGSVVGSFFDQGDIVVDGNTIHTGTRYETIDISDPSQPKIIGKTALATPGIIHSLALNGSGRMISLISFRASDRFLAVYDATSLTNVDNFLVSYSTLSTARDHDLAGGLVLVADSRAGLTIMNTANFDGAGVPPHVTLDLTYLDTDPAQPGIQVSAGSTVQARAVVRDDTQIREARVLLDGQVVGVIEPGPVVFALQLPGQVPTNGVVTVQVEAVDTGGNVGASPSVDLELVPDLTPPLLLSSIPRDGGAAFAEGGFAFRFNEELQRGSLAPELVTLVSAGVDGQLGTADDSRVPIASASVTGATLNIFPASPLAVGPHRLTLAAAAMTDRAGNKRPEDLGVTFTALAAGLDGALWISGADGRWDNPTNWLYHRVPGRENVLLPSGLGQPVVKVSTKNLSLLSFDSHLPVRFEQGSTVVLGPAAFRAPVAISNATLWVEAPSTFSDKVTVQGGELALNTAVDFQGLLTLNRGAVLTLDGAAAKANLIGGLDALNFTIAAENGATFNLPQFTNYDGPGDFALFLPAGTHFKAVGAGSKITLPNLVAASGPTNWIVRAVPTLSFEVSSGGSIELPELRTLTGRTLLAASGQASRITAPKLEAVTGPVSDFVSSASVSNRGELELGTTTALERCRVSMTAPATCRAGTIELGAESSLEGSGSITGNLINQGLITLNQGTAPLVIGGDLQLSSTSVIASTLGLGADKTGSGQGQVLGSTALSGTLRLTSSRGFTPASGQEFVILTWPALPTGALNRIDDAGLGSSLTAAPLVSGLDLRVRIGTR